MPDRLPPLTWLRAFEAAARHLSFTRAAGDLNLTQSAVSQHVRSLETFLGRDLFVRKTRALELTEAGGNYLPVIREAFELIASGTQAFTGGDRGRSLVLQCNMAFSVFWLAPRLSALYARHPWLVLNIVTPIWDPERHAGNAGVEIRFGRREDMSEAAERLTQEQFFPVCAAGYRGGAIDLDRAVLMDCARITGSWSAWFSSQGKSFERADDITLASTFVIAIEAARHGAGITMAHGTLTADLLASGALIQPFEHAPPLSEGYYMFPPARHTETPATRAFVGWLKEELHGQVGLPAPLSGGSGGQAGG
ncbi:MAG: LysR family transcriptional regulator [Pseudomonadota bacterium]